MEAKSPKYSIIIPTYNGIDYLPTCLESITQQNYNDYEIILSDDHSTDGTRDFLEELKDEKIKVFYPPTSLSMTEHWEWALGHASGEWQIFVGQDDGLQPYFFKLADKLVQEAKERNLRTIMSSRAYFFWKGCEFVYGDYAISYQAMNKIKIHNLKFETIKALLGFQDYFELPQMYTTSLFHKDLLVEARREQNGNVFCCHPQDANLAAVALGFESHYLKSYIPLGWVGSSVKSAGMAIFSDTSKTNRKDAEEIESLKNDYKSKLKKSSFKYNERAGDFSFGNLAIYLWQALLETRSIQSKQVKRLLDSKLFMLIFFSSVYITTLSKKDSDKLILIFKDIVQKNNVSFLSVKNMTFLFHIVNFIKNILNVPNRALNKFSKKLTYFRKWSDNINVDMIQDSTKINEKIKNKMWV